MLRVMGLDKSMMVSDSPSTFVNNAIAIAASGRERDQLVAQITARSSLLYDNSDVVQDWERMLRNLHVAYNE